MRLLCVQEAETARKVLNPLKPPFSVVIGTAHIGVLNPATGIVVICQYWSVPQTGYRVDDTGLMAVLMLMLVCAEAAGPSRASSAPALSKRKNFIIDLV